MSVSLSVSLSTRISRKTDGQNSLNFLCLLPVRGRGSVLPDGAVMLCTSGFVDDVRHVFTLWTQWRRHCSVVHTPAAWSWLRPVVLQTTVDAKSLVQGIPGRQGRCHGVEWGGRVHPTFFPRVFLGLSRCGAYWLYPQTGPPTWEGTPFPIPHPYCVGIDLKELGGGSDVAIVKSSCTFYIQLTLLG